MSLIEKIGLTWLCLIGILGSTVLGILATICPFLIVLIFLMMMAVGGFGWCAYQIWKIWSDNF